MNIFKKNLAMFLVICMLISAVPVTVFGSEADGTVPEVTDAPEVTDVPKDTEESETTEDSAGEAAGSVETLAADSPVNVTLWVGQTQTITDDTGNYQNSANNDQPDTAFATMIVTGQDGVTGDNTLVEVTDPELLVDGAKYVIVSERSSTAGLLTNETYEATISWSKLSVKGLNTNGTVSADTEHKWSIIPAGSGTYYVKYGDTYLTFSYTDTSTAELTTTATPLSLEYSNGYWYIKEDGIYLSNVGGFDYDYYGASGFNEQSGSGWKIYEIDDPTPGSTEISFTGVAPGTTTAVVGNTTYNITVTALEQTVNIELEVGETFTYTDATGNHADKVTTQPDGTYATMTVTNLEAIAEKKLVEVTTTSFNAAKRYVIVNKRTNTYGHAAYQPNDTVLTSTEIVDGAIGLDMNGPLSEDTTDVWIIVSDGNGGYYLKSGDEYVTIGNRSAEMTPTATSLTLAYNADNSAWTIRQDGYYLSDLYGANSGEAFGYNVANDDGNYWIIYEVVEARPESTQVVFTGEAAGETTAKVGYTTYNITVVEQETDDEIENTRTNGWTVDPEVQADRITDATVENSGYTTATWEEYQAALTAANEKMAEVSSTVYTSKEAAQKALDELDAKVDALESAKNALEVGKAITIRYWRVGAVALTETIYVSADAATYELGPTKTLDGVTYNLSTTTLNLAGGVAVFDVQLLREGYATEGIVGEANISNTNVLGRSVKEMTVTAGVEYNLGLADILTDGQYVDWASNNTAVATVGADGIVTAVAEGTATVTAAIKDADGNVVKTYETTVNVLPGVAEGTATREVAVYIDQCDNTSAVCVIHANGAQNELGDSTNHFNAFAVVDLSEGELVYGKFQSTNTETDATAGFTGLTFLSCPDDEYILTFMSSTNSAGDYMPLRNAAGKVVADDGTPLGSKYYISSYGSAPGLHDGLISGQGITSVAYTDAIWTGQIIPMAKYFASLKYDGAMGFNRPATHGGIYTNLSFAAEPMPTVDKVVDGVLPTGGKFQNYQRYVPNMVAAVDEIVFFEITVTLERPNVWQKNSDGTVATDTDGNPLAAVVYTDAKLIDTALEVVDTTELDAYFYTKELDQADNIWDGQIDADDRVNEQDITDAMNKGWADDEKVRVLEYYVVYKIKSTDIPKFNIANVVQFKYNYSSSYSSGALTSTADADADITVIGEAMDNVVIDFGQTFVYSGLTNRHLKGVFVNGTNDDEKITQCKAVADYGTVTVTREHMKDENGNLLYEGTQDGTQYPQYEYTVTYTPTTILQAPDMVRLYGIGEENQEKIINGFIVYPATTVYYEEGFAFTGTYSGWDLDNSKKATVNQELEHLGKTNTDGNVKTIVSGKIHAYGYDPIYENAAAPNGSYAESTEKNSKTVFEFTGDGIQIFANCTEKTGYVAVEVRDVATNRVVRMSMVDTVVKAGDTNATNQQKDNMNGLPVVSLLNIQNMPHGTYQVTISKVMDSEPVYIDGIRIFNTIAQNDNDSPFTIDLEDRPDFYELRDAVLHAVGVNAGTTEDYKGRLTQQIYDETQGASALILDENVTYEESWTIQDLLDNGPKNELFLYSGQTLSFKVRTNRVMQVGLKAPQGETAASITVTTKDENATKDVSIKSSVDMFYYLVDKPAGTETEYTVSITNTGDKMLSVTLLKICDDPNAAFSELTKEDIEDILEGIYGKVESILGNIDDDGDVDVDDVLALLWYVLFPEDYPIEAEADFDGSSTVDVDDVLALLWYVLFPDDYPLN